jgi:hypothetical protein
MGLVFLLTGAAQAADDPFAGFISPVSNPVNFEDPRPMTELRPIYAYHDIDEDFLAPLLSGGHAHVAALQARVALSDRFALIATKDGYVWLQPDQTVPNVVDKDDGWANIAFGAKYAVYKDPDPEMPGMITVGLRYEMPSGEPAALQGSVFKDGTLRKQGNGILNGFVSGMWGMGDFHGIGYMGTRWALSGTDSSFFDMSLHFDYRIWNLFPLIEFNWVQGINGGNRLQPVASALNTSINQEGFDFFNLGSPQSGGNGVVTGAAGLRWRILDSLVVIDHPGGVDFGVVYELPLTGRKDIFGWRVTSDISIWFF